MNARSHTLELTVDSRQVEESVLSLCHTIMLHRSSGKFSYKQEGSYTEGTIGIEDIQCDFVDFTYVRMTSDSLNKVISKHVSDFIEDMSKKRTELSTTMTTIKGMVTIEFFQKRQTKWSLFDEPLPWEVWNLVISEKMLTTESERKIAQESIGDRLAEKVFCITEAMNKDDFIPKMPVQSELHLIFDNTFVDVQPYLFKISHRIGGDLNSSTPPSSSISSKVMRMFR